MTYPFDEPEADLGSGRDEARESEAVAALRRAGIRAVYHLLRAGVEGLKAVEAVVDELGKVRRDDEDDDDRPPEGRVRIEVE